MENLLKHKLEKMLIFDQKILEVAIGWYHLLHILKLIQYESYLYTCTDVLISSDLLWIVK